MNLPQMTTTHTIVVTYTAANRTWIGTALTDQAGDWIAVAPGQPMREFPNPAQAEEWLREQVYLSAMCDADNIDRDLDDPIPARRVA